MREDEQRLTIRSDAGKKQVDTAVAGYLFFVSLAFSVLHRKKGRRSGG